jgi:hypothetical protein
MWKAAKAGTFLVLAEPQSSQAHDSEHDLS